MLQGGGALGAYQIGVYQALSEAGCEPNWLSGVSIGAVNSAIIAGNPPERRLKHLEAFWNKISGRKIWAYTPEGDPWRDLRNRTSSLFTLLMGQPGFFKPRVPNPWLQLPGADGATSFYDSSELAEHARGAGRFRPPQQWPQAAERRRGQCPHRQLPLFRLRQAEDRPGAYHGIGRSSAGAAGR